jgi:hypothetical protein
MPDVMEMSLTEIKDARIQAERDIADILRTLESITGARAAASIVFHDPDTGTVERVSLHLSI